MWLKKKKKSHVLSSSTMIGVSPWKQYQTFSRELLASSTEIRYQITSHTSHLLQGRNALVRGASGLNQWRKTKDTVEWFKGLEDRAFKFFQFDFESFYPSISSKLFDEAIKWSEEFVPITEEDRALLFHIRKSFLFFGRESLQEEDQWSWPQQQRQKQRRGVWRDDGFFRWGGSMRTLRPRRPQWVGGGGTISKGTGGGISRWWTRCT